MKDNAITVQNLVKKPIDKVWESWTSPEHITQWNQASPEWHCPKASNDVSEGGNFSFTMAAKDGSFSFDLTGVYSNVVKNAFLAYTFPDGRDVEVRFSEVADGVEVVQTFDPEHMNPLDLQRLGWQSIMDSFKSYTEGLS